MRTSGIEQRHPQNRRISRHRLARIDFHAPTVTDHHDASVRSENVEVAIEVDVGEHLQDDVDALSARK